MSTKTTMKASPIPYVMKPNFISVNVGGKSYSLDNTHPTFKDLAKALKKKEWKKVPKLVSIAEKIFSISKGDVILKDGVVLYKGREIHSTLTNRIVQLLKEEKPVQHLLLFMANLYKNPSQEAIAEFYQWLVNNDLPITDDGCFLAYKSVDDKFRDEHTHKIDNSPGQIIMMRRKDGDPNWRTQCSSGYHICSKQYGLYGREVMAIKCNPKDVLSANSGKIRTVRYEVLFHLGRREDEHKFKLDGFSQLEKKIVIELRKERGEMIRMLLKAPAVKKAIRRKVMSKSTIVKSAYARLVAMVQRFGIVEPPAPKVGPEAKYFLKPAREAAGLTVGQVAKKMGYTYKQVATLEKKNDTELNQEQTDKYLGAIAELSGVKYLNNAAITFPKPYRA